MEYISYEIRNFLRIRARAHGHGGGAQSGKGQGVTNTRCLDGQHTIIAMRLSILHRQRHCVIRLLSCILRNILAQR